MVTINKVNKVFLCLCLLLLRRSYSFRAATLDRTALRRTCFFTKRTTRRPPRPIRPAGEVLFPDLLLTATTNTQQPEESPTKLPEKKKLCLYRNAATDNQWEERMELQDLAIGQELQGVVVQRLLEAKTGPKLFLDCGIGRIDRNGNWQIVNAMLRLINTGRKLSVAQKKASRLAKKDAIPVYVSRIFLPSSQLEVSLTPPAKQGPLQSTSSLQPKDEVFGVPILYKDYGIFVRLLPNYNRRGLLHISKISAALGMYIGGADGLKKFASNFDDEDGIPLVVVANHKKRGLEMDLSDGFKEALEEERKSTTISTTSKENALTTDNTEAGSPEMNNSESTDVVGNYDDYYAEYADYADPKVDEEKDKYDEESEIEDALGLGYY